MPAGSADESSLPGGRWTARATCLAVVAVGASAMITQLTVLRELLGVFAGNELVFGVMLGTWLALMGAGAYLGRFAGRLRNPLAVLAGGQVLLAVLPPATVAAVRLARYGVFLRGVALGLTEALVATLAVLLPYCLVSGFLLTLACTLLSRIRGTAGPPTPDGGDRAGGIAGVYLLDSLGGIFGGLAFAVVLVHVWKHFGILYASGAMNLAAGLLLAGAARRPVALVLIVLASAGLALTAALADLEARTLALQFDRQHVVFHGNSPYGALVVTEQAGQYNFVSNGRTMLTTGDRDQAEETVHYVMAQRPGARRVLLIGGGVSGTTAEILKWPGVTRLDYVELDPLVLAAADKFMPGRLADPRVHVHVDDGRRFVQHAAPDSYDVVILDVPEPATLQANRLYTAEFFREVRRILGPPGVLGFSLGQYESYLTPEAGGLIATTRRTLSEAFAHVLILPPGRLVYLAGDGELTPDVAGRIEAAGIATQRVRRGYLEGTLTPDRFQAVARCARAIAEPNRDFAPVLYYYQVRQWVDRHRVRVGALGAVLAVTAGLFLIRAKPVALAVFTTGFAAAGLQIVLVLSFQILHGALYDGLGWLMATFMLGLAAGSWTSRRRRRWGWGRLIVLEFVLAAFAAALPAVLGGLGVLAGAGAWAQGLVPALTFVLAGLVGLEFPLAARVSFEDPARTAGRLYLADLLGACLGAMLVSTLLIPLIGAEGVCWAVAAVNVVSGGVLLLTRKKTFT